MLLINEKEEKVTDYDCRLLDREKAMNTMVDLIRKLEIKRYELPNEEIEARKEETNTLITSPVYDYEALKSQKSSKVTEIKSSTPYTIAFLGTYMQNNWLDMVCNFYIGSAKEQMKYLKIQLKRMYSHQREIFPLFGTDDNTKKILEYMKKQPEIFSKFLQEYYPDAYAFKEIFSYIELNAIKSNRIYDNNLLEDTLDIAYANNDIIRLLDLTPNIRK